MEVGVLCVFEGGERVGKADLKGANREVKNENSLAECSFPEACRDPLGRGSEGLCE